MSDVLKPSKEAASSQPTSYLAQATDTDPAETQEWIDSLEYVINSKGDERAKYLLSILEAKARNEGVELPTISNTPYINTIHVDDQIAFPGNRELERRLKSIIRWNAMAMVVKANNDFKGIGGHLSTFASSATLYQIAFNHFLRGRGESGYDGDHIFFQGHGSPGMYAQSFLEGRLTEKQITHTLG